jgi:hypothetical protein
VRTKGNRTVDIKTGYAGAQIDLEQARNYKRLVEASRTNPELAKKLGGALKGHDYMFLPARGQNAADAALSAFRQLQADADLQGFARVFYQGSDGKIYQVVGEALPPRLVGAALP